MVEEQLSKRSVIKPSKLFTIHRNLIATRYGSVKQHKLLEALRSLREIFADLKGV